MNLTTKTTSLILLIVVCASLGVKSQSYRSLLNWKRDLDFRLNSYLSKLDAINNILATSIHSSSGGLNGPTRISGSHVRFTDLIIPRGALVLNNRIARPSVSILVNKTQNYLNLKTTELSQIKHQLETFKRQLNDGNQRYIHKGGPNLPVQSIRVPGTRVFKQFLYGKMISATSTVLKKINHTEVDKVIDDTYMINPSFGLRDHKSRLFFEGKKTFWKTTFRASLNSGCCDRLRPLHTNRMMTRTGNQDIVAPVMFHTESHLNREPIVIERLNTPRLSNRILAVGLISGRPNDVGLIPSPMENPILQNSLVPIRNFGIIDLGSKTLVFKNTLVVKDVFIPTAQTGGKTFISVATKPEINFDISHNNYLLRNLNLKNGTMFHLDGRLIINGKAHFSANIETMSVNDVDNFNQFVRESIVRIDRPANISGVIDFIALPPILTQVRPTLLPQSFTTLSVEGSLNVGLINGMRFPSDVVFIPRSPQEALIPIVIRGSRTFANQLIFQNALEVKQLVNNMQIPDGVIPLHQDDSVNSLGYSNLVFLDGIAAGDVVIQSRKLGDLDIGDAHASAQNIIMRSMITLQPDGTHLINVPLRIRNLQLVNREPNRGLLNGFRPENILELFQSYNNYLQTIHGKKVFTAPVEVTECIFNEINSIPDWTSHLIRVDRPNTVQTVHSRLAFLQPPLYNELPNAINYPSPIGIYNNTTGSLVVNHLRVDFLPNNDALNYLSNFELSPEFYILHQALSREIANHTEGRIRVNHLRLMNPQATVNGVPLDDIITVDTPFKFSGRFVMVGKVDVRGSVIANRVSSNYPFDSMDLVQFDKYRIPLANSQGPIRLNNLVLSTGNRASFVQCYMLNGIKFSEFANSIMSITKPQTIESRLIFDAPVTLGGFARTASSLNGIPNFRKFASDLKNAVYSFEDGLQCNSVIIKT